MNLKTMRPTYSGADMVDKISMLISYVEELSEEISFRLENLSQAVENIKKDVYGERNTTYEST